MKPSPPASHSPAPDPTPSAMSGQSLGVNGQPPSVGQGTLAGRTAATKPRSTGMGLKITGGIVAVCAMLGIYASLIQHSTQPPLVGPFPGDAQNQVIPQTPLAAPPLQVPVSPPSSDPNPVLSSANGSSPAAPAVTPASDGHIMVHVSGQVARPGVYTLDSNARIADAIAQAGGALPDGDPNALNLAAHLTDGTKLEVPARQNSGLGAPSAGNSTSPLQSQPPNNVPTGVPNPNSLRAVMGGAALDLNTATQAQLEALPGVGPIMATHIIEYRLRVGRFNSVDDLDNVNGIGPKKLAELRPFLVVR